MNKRKYSLFFVIVSLVVGFLSAQVPTGKSMTKEDVEKAVQVLAEKGYFGQGEFISTVKEAGPTGIPVLKKYLAHSNPDVRRVVLTALWMIHAPCSDVFDAVIPLLQDENKWVRYNAVFYATMQKCKALRPGIRVLIEKEEDEQILKIAIESLGSVGDQSDLQFLNEYQSQEGSSRTIRLSAALAISKMKGSYDQYLISSALNGSVEEQAKALQILAETNNKGMIDKVEKLTAHAEPIHSLSLIALCAIETNNDKIGTNEKIELLFSFLNSFREEDVQKWIVYRLIHDFDSPQIRERLLLIAKDNTHPASLATKTIMLFNHLVEERELEDE